jgi:hypothetical protein
MAFSLLVRQFGRDTVRATVNGFWAAWLPFVPSVPAQEPPAAPPTIRHDLAAAPLAAGKRALAEGKRAEASTHLQHAFAEAPGSLEILALLVEASADDADARTLWLHEWMDAAVGPAGVPVVDADAKKRLPADDPRPQQLATDRAAAIDELLKLARDREKESASRIDALLVAQWARRVALDLARPCPSLQKAREAELSPRLTVPDSLPAKVVKSLETFANGALTNSKTADAIKAGRILAGYGTQLAFGKDLQGGAPSGVGSVRERASALLARARQQLGNKIEQPWSVDELLALDGPQAEAFTRAHDSFANPGVAKSPQGWYRIETDCGFNTLLGAAQTIEQHHKRLASWFGQDPFVGKPGLARIVPEAAGMEAESEPFWWAGGFQSGDVTTVRFSCSDIEGLGHLLTHELTHRFDGAVYPGIPSWLAEGRAVWTGGSYGRAADEKFVEGYASVGTIEAAFLKGYGDGRNLVRLIEGTIDDYRDNYTAGYALYVYLNTRKNAAGKLLFRERLQKFMKEARSSKKTKEHFAQCFADGKEDRPKELEGFVADWAPWLAGFYWQVRAKSPWVHEYEVQFNYISGMPVMDEPTWVWSRNRAEPRFGQEQAALTGNLLLSAGKRADAIAAYVWALAVDGRRPAEEQRLAEALEAEARRDAAWVVKCGIEQPYGARVGAAPFLGSLGKVKALLDGLEAAGSDAASRGLLVTAGALHAERERLAAWLGVERSTGPDVVDASKCLRPLDPISRPLVPPIPLGAAGPGAGWIETGLTDYEERRAKGRWYVDENSHLHVGREKPRTATGSVDRASAQVDCFALAPEWQLPGTWRLDARIRFTTSCVNGAVIFGYTEREQNLRFAFSAGDFLYATGVSEKAPEFNDMGWSLGGLRERDGGLPGSTSGGGFAFGSSSASFELTLLVDGSFVQAFVNGKPLGKYQTVDGAAIEGQIGFATSMGAIEVEEPRVTRLEHSRLAPSAAFAPTCFDLNSARSLPPWDASNRTAVGLPRLSQGTLLLWIATPAVPVADDTARAGFLASMQWELREFAAFVEHEQPTQKLLIAVPAVVGESGRQFIADYSKKVIGAGVETLLHQQPFIPDGVESPRSRRWLMFIDSAGIVRALSELPSGLFVSKDPNFSRWLEVFRDHGRPPRDLPAVERPKVAPTPKEDPPRND